MADDPWLSIVGIGEDGPDGLSSASRLALEAAECVIGPPRHLALLPDLAAERIAWPVPFSDGVETLLSLRGRNVVALASGDPFWFGAGSILTARLEVGEWRAFPVPSTFSIIASRLGWALERTGCFGLHAAPFARLRPDLAPKQRLIVLVRDGEAVHRLASYLVANGFGASRVSVFEAVGGPREQRTEGRADGFGPQSFAHPVAVAIAVEGDGAVLPLASGRPDHVFEHDGQITKRAVRAMTLSALAPRHGEHLWDIGGGSGSVSIEWLLCHPSLSATTIEARKDRADRIHANADRLGCDRLKLVHGDAPAALDGVAPPNAVFIGGGLSDELLAWLTGRLPSGTRIVANAVTLESEALLLLWSDKIGGALSRLEIAQAAPLGPRRGWDHARPIVQWSVTL
ncbi:MAG: precorrin-6y C5,15-methyltransferase (decarboxylating) subunit CbiE [Pseudomonadota bacterium]